jgi:hypothetical protein
MLGADGLAIDGALHEGELAILHVEERAWIERGSFALSGGRLRVRSRSSRRSLRRPLPRAGGGEQTAQARRLVFLRKALLFGIDGTKPRHRLRPAGAAGRRRDLRQRLVRGETAIIPRQVGEAVGRRLVVRVVEFRPAA